MDTCERSLILTKDEAAARHVEAAVSAFESGDFDICITLAGAAEGMLSDRKGGDFFSYAKGKGSEKGLNPKDWIACLNLERDWLKHPTFQLPPQCEFGREEAAMMLMRAMSKLPTWSESMMRIKPVVEDCFR
ncbi:MAG TPA: hypothetical protein VIJ06_00020 [Methylovirgula sp.]